MADHPRSENPGGPMWDDERRRERERRRLRASDDEWNDADRREADRREADRRSRWREDEDADYRSFGDAGPIRKRSGVYGGQGRPYGASGRYDDLSPGYRDFEADQRRIHRGAYEPARYTPNAREARAEEPRSWWDRTQDEVSSWFGDEHARRRREWDGRTSDLRAEHRGRGPKSYKRSDGRIHEDINDRLTDDPYVDASDIEVSVKDGEATLSGFVTRKEDKRRAEDIADAVSGVKHVQNNLRVRPAEPTATTAGLDF
jgi:hypothetical protein